MKCTKCESLDVKVRETIYRKAELKKLIEFWEQDL